MPNRTIITPLVGFTLVIAAIYAHSQLPTWALISKTAGAVGFCLLAWDFYLWRFPGAYSWNLAPLPHLRGTWKIGANIFTMPNSLVENDPKVVQVSYEAPKGHVVIRQTGSGFRFTALWDDGDSSTMEHLSPVTSYEGWGTFVGHYQQKGGNHVGISGVVVYNKAHPSEASIYYTTIEEKPQRGFVKLSNRVRQFCDTHEEAAKLPPDSKRCFRTKLGFWFRLR